MALVSWSLDFLQFDWVATSFVTTSAAKYGSELAIWGSFGQS